MGLEERFCEECLAIPPNSKIHSSYIPKDVQPSLKISCGVSKEKAQQQGLNNMSISDLLDNGTEYDPNACAGCKYMLKDGQALIALDRQWHINCFRFENELIILHKPVRNNAKNSV